MFEGVGISGVVGELDNLILLLYLTGFLSTRSVHVSACYGPLGVSCACVVCGSSGDVSCHSNTSPTIIRFQNRCCVFIAHSRNC